MKLPSTLALALLLAISGSLKADEGEALDLTTLTGKTYSHCQIMKMYPDGVAFRHARGIAKVLFSDLTPEWQKHFGYDPEKVRAYERKVKDDTLKLRETAAARADEAHQAWLDANQGTAEPTEPYNGTYQPGGNYGYNDFVPMSPLGWADYGNSIRSPLRPGTLRDGSGRFFNEGRSAVTVPVYGRVQANRVPVSANGYTSAGLRRPWVAPLAIRSKAAFKAK